MSKRSRKSDKRRSNQPSLLDLIESAKPAPNRPGAYDVAAQIREALTAAIKSTPPNVTRNQIAATMSDLTGTVITRTMLDAWTAESKDGHRIPAEFVPAFCRATNDYRLYDVLTEPVGGRFFKGRAALVAEAGQIEAQINALKDRKRELQRHLAELGED